MTLRLGRTVAAAALASAAFFATVPSALAFYGSYADSCRVLSDDGTYMTAYCRRVDGSWRWTAIASCDGIGVRNDDGRLQCGT